MSTLDPAPENTSAIEQVRVVLMDLGNELKEKGGSAAEYLSERANQIFDTREKIEALQQIMSKEDLETAFGIAREQVEQLTSLTKTKLDDLRQQMRIPEPVQEFYNENKETIKAVGIVAGIVAGALVVYHMGKKLFGKAEEKAKSGFKKLTLFLAGIGIAVGGIFLGKEYMEKRIAQKAEEIRKKAEEELASIEEKMKAATEEQRMELEKKKQELLERMKKIEEEAKKRQKETEPQTPEQPENDAEELKNSVMTYGLSRGVVAFTESGDWNIRDEAKTRLINDILHTENAKPATERKTVEQILSQEQPFELGAGEEENRKKAAETLQAFCITHEDQAIDYVMDTEGISQEEGTKRISQMDIISFLKLAASSYSATVPMLDALQESSGNYMEAFQKMDVQKYVAGDTSVQEELSSFIKEHEADLHLDLEEVSLPQLLKVAMQANTLSLGSFTQVSATEIDPYKRILGQIARDVESGNVQNYMLPLFHEILPDDPEWSEDMQSNLDRVKGYLLGRMSASQALRMYLYSRMIKRGNPAGITLMQLEIPHFIAKTENDWLPERKSLVIIRLIKEITNSTAEEIAEKWKKLNIEIDPRIIEQARKALVTAVETGTNAAMNHISPWQWTRETLGIGFAAIRSNPKVILGSTATGYVISAEALRHLENIKRKPSTVDRTLNTWAESYSDARSLPEQAKRIFREQGLLNITSTQEIEEAAHAFHTIREKITKIPPLQRGELMKLLNTCVHSESTLSAWQELEAAVLKHPILGSNNEVLSALNSMVRSAGVREAFEFGRSKKFILRLKPVAAFIRMHGKVRKAVINTAKGGTSILGRVVPNTPRIPRIPGGKVLGKALRAGGTVLAGGLVAYDAYDLMMARGPELEKQIAEETDPLKKEILIDELRALRIKLGANTVATGLDATGVGLVVGLSLTAATEGASALRDSIAEGTKYMLMSENDLVGKSDAQILDIIAQTSEGSATFGQYLATNSENRNLANRNIRAEAYRAYFAKRALDLPVLGPEYLTKDDRKQDSAEQQRRLQIISNDQARRFSLAASEYIQHKTNSEYTLPNPDVLREAETYAFMFIEQWRMNLLDEKPIQLASLSWQERESKVQSSLTSQEQVVINILNAIHEEDLPAWREQTASALLKETEHDIGLFDHRINAADLTGWSWTGSEEESRTKVRSAAFFQVKRTLEQEIAKLEKRNPMSSADWNSAIASVRTLLTKDPVQFETAAQEITEGSTELSPLALLEQIQQHFEVNEAQAA